MNSVQESAGLEGPLTVTIRVKPAAEAACAVADTGASDDVVQNLVSGSDGFVCRADVRTDETSAKYLTSDVDQGCICAVLQNHECVWIIESVGRGELEYSLSLPDRDELACIVESIRDTGATIQLRRISAPNGERHNGRYEFEIDSITDKQREAVRAAIEAGYYDTPRGADLEDLAEMIGVSRSAVSQRLTSVESKLVTELCRMETTLNGSE